MDSIDEYIRKQAELVERFGWAAQGVLPTATHPPFIYTVGLNPEFMIRALPMPVAHQILRRLVEMDPTPEVGEPFTGLLENDMRTVLVPYSGPLEDWGMAYNWRNGDERFGKLQLLWPDEQGRLPTEPGMDPRFRLIQGLGV